MSRRAAGHRVNQRKLIDRLEVAVAKGYRESIDEIKAGVNVSKLTERLKAHDIEGALDALNIEAAAFGPLRNAIIGTFEAGGKLATANLPTIVEVKR